MVRNSAADGGSVIEPARTMLRRLCSGVYIGEPFVGVGGFGWKKNLRMNRCFHTACGGSLSLQKLELELSRMVILSEAFIYVA